MTKAKVLDIFDCPYYQAGGGCAHDKRSKANCFVKARETCTLNDVEHYTLRSNGVVVQQGSKPPPIRKAKPPAPPVRKAPPPPPPL